VRPVDAVTVVVYASKASGMRGLKILHYTSQIKA